MPARECISARSLVFHLLSHTSQLYSLSNIFLISCIPHVIYSLFHLFRIYFCLIPYLFHVSAQIVPQLLGGSNRISKFGSCLKSSLDSSHVSQSVMCNKDWDREQLEEQDVDRGNRHSVFCWDIRTVTYEIGYIQPIHWWDFCFTFWQGIEPWRHLLEYKFCLRILLSLNLTSDLWSPTFD